MRRLSAKTFRLAAMTTASAAVAACGLSSAAPTNSLLAGPTGQPITVGISLPLGGSTASDPFSADGQACRIGYQLWASDVNSHGGLLGRPVRLKILDDKGSEPLTRANYQTLIKTDHVDLVLAPFSSLLTIDAAKVTSKYGYALAAGSAARRRCMRSGCGACSPPTCPHPSRWCRWPTTWPAFRSASARPPLPTP
jgi:branched-chain amino acid transport system substrate-binding protein